MTRRCRTTILTLLAPVLVALACSSAPAAAGGPPRVYSPNARAMLSVKGTDWLGSLRTTWYGPGLYGNTTGCGTTLRRSTWGIAHRTLPCGTMVFLGFRGRRVAVPVVDRGPYGAYDVDMTERVASRLRFKGIDSAGVRVGVMDYRLPLDRL